MKIHNNSIQLYSDKIKRDYTFCLLSDIHNTKFSKMKMYLNLIEIVKRQNPNAIFIPGDFIYLADDLSIDEVRYKLDYLLNHLSKIAPIYLSLGNHDMKNGKTKSAKDTLLYFETLGLENENIYLLNNRTVLFDKDIYITGFSPRFDAYYSKYENDWINYFIEDFITSKLDFNDEYFNIFLTHSPEIISRLENYINSVSDENDCDKVLKQKLKELTVLLGKLDLILCGHMHDGAIPKHWQKLGLVRSDKGIAVNESDKLKELRFRIVEKCRGIHDVFSAKMIVTGGITKWVQPNSLFMAIGSLAAKDMTTIKLLKK